MPAAWKFEETIFIKSGFGRDCYQSISSEAHDDKDHQPIFSADRVALGNINFWDSDHISYIFLFQSPQTGPKALFIYYI